MAKCNVCFRQCEIKESGLGFCMARGCKDGVVYPLNYGKVTSLALDPIEKKPLARFMPGTKILSVGSYGCNLRCPFCQNSEISWDESVRYWHERAEDIPPKELVDEALYYKSKGNIGVAYTYNEPLIGYEYVRDCAKLIHENGMKNVLVTNGTAKIGILEELIPYIDAMNIDLKGINEDYYNDTLGGNIDMVKDFISYAVKHCHVELTTLIVPDENDTEEEILKLCEWIASLKDEEGKVIGKEIPLHITRFFPHFHMTDRDPTDVKKIYRLAEVARRHLKYVYKGNC